jgi:hypothetical protein
MIKVDGSNAVCSTCLPQQVLYAFVIITENMEQNRLSREVFHLFIQETSVNSHMRHLC